MEKTGYTNNRVIKSAVLISEGRNKIMLAGHEAQGRKLLSKGISEAKQIFKDVKVSGNIKSIVQAELTFIEQELNHSTNPLAIKSLEIAKTSFTDALNSYHVLGSVDTK
jgi:hypothetical protein